MHEINGAYVRVSVVGCVSHTLCPLTEQFKLFVCHRVVHHVLIFAFAIAFDLLNVVPIAVYLNRECVVRIGHGVYPRFHFTCKGFFYVLKSVADVLFHVLEFLELMWSALFIPSIHAFALSGSGIDLAHLPDLMVSTVVTYRGLEPREHPPCHYIRLCSVVC